MIDTVKSFWTDAAMIGESMPFCERMATVQRSTGTGFTENWRQGPINPRLFDVYRDFCQWATETGQGPVVSLALFVEASEGLGFQVQQISRQWVGPDSVTVDKQPTCLRLLPLGQLREALGVADYFKSDRYQPKAA